MTPNKNPNRTSRDEIPPMQPHEDIGFAGVVMGIGTLIGIVATVAFLAVCPNPPGSKAVKRNHIGPKPR